MSSVARAGAAAGRTGIAACAKGGPYGVAIGGVGSGCAGTAGAGPNGNGGTSSTGSVLTASTVLHAGQRIIFASGGTRSIAWHVGHGTSSDTTTPEQAGSLISKIVARPGRPQHDSRKRFVNTR
jgi:hypothetical protein